jgi:DNA-binding GntR family transcriptional regulator
VAKAFAAIREAVLLGRFQPGQRISQVAIARELGLGRTPLREALRMLQRDGLVRFEPNQRIRIANLGAAEVEGLYLMRMVLEGMAVRLTVPAFGPRQVARLDYLLTVMEEQERQSPPDSSKGPEERARQALAWTKDASHREFHMRFVADAGEGVVERIGELSDHADRYRMAYRLAAPEAGGERIVEHRAMLEAAADRDVTATVDALNRHYAHTAKAIIDQLEPGYEPWRLQETIEHLEDESALLRGAEG